MDTSILNLPFLILFALLSALGINSGADEPVAPDPATYGYAFAEDDSNRLAYFPSIDSEGTEMLILGQTDGEQATVERIVFFNESDPSKGGEMIFSESGMSISLNDGSSATFEEIAEDIAFSIVSPGANESYSSTLNTLTAKLEESKQQKASSVEAQSSHADARGGTPISIELLQTPTYAFQASSTPAANDESVQEVVMSVTSDCGEVTTGAAKTMIRPASNFGSGALALAPKPPVIASMDYEDSLKSWYAAVPISSFNTVADVAGAISEEYFIELIESRVESQITKYAVEQILLTLASPELGVPKAIVQTATNIYQVYGLYDKFSDQVEAGKYLIQMTKTVYNDGDVGNEAVPVKVSGEYASPYFYGKTSGETLVQQPGVEVADLSISPDGEVQTPELSAITLEPIAPTAGQYYSASFSVSCDTIEGMTVDITVVGTDSYTQFETFPVTPGGVYRIVVPGAVSGVQDTVTAGLYDSEGQQLDQSIASLVFQ